MGGRGKGWRGRGWRDRGQPPSLPYNKTKYPYTIISLRAVLPWGKLPLGNIAGGLLSILKIFIKNFLENICDVGKVVIFVHVLFFWAVSAYA
jgi:hypothetical protein